MNRMVFWRDVRRRLVAAAITRRISATLLSTPLNLTNFACVRSAMMCASVVLPVPGGPDKITDGKRSASMARRSSFPGPRMCSWPTNSSSERGRRRVASGAVEFSAVKSASFSLKSSGTVETMPAGRGCMQVRLATHQKLPRRLPVEEFATFLLALKSIELEGQVAATRATCLVRWRGTPEFGDELKLLAIAEPIAPSRNPGEFDMRNYLARRDVHRLLFVRYPEAGVLLRHGAGNPILRLAQQSRAWMQWALCRGLEKAPDVQAFLSGIVLGQRHQTPEDIEEPFQQTGTLHLLAVAGLHVGIVARLLWILSGVAQLPRKSATALIIPLVLFYAAVTGLHVSTARASGVCSLLRG